MYSMSLIWTLIRVFVLSFVGTIAVNMIFRYFGYKGLMGNLFPNVRGGIPRAVGIVPFIILSFWLPTGYNTLVLIIGICALIDDVMGRRLIFDLPIEWGQFSRGIGMILVMLCGLISGFGISSILIALLIQPLNIADMQPGSASIVTMGMSLLTIIIMLIVGVAPIQEIPAIYTPLLIFIVCLAYSPFDFAGKIMMGEVGNHSFAVALGIGFYMIGGFIPTLILSIVTIFFSAFVRRNTLKIFFREKLNITNPTFGDYFMDALTGGGLGDLIRKMVLGQNQYRVKNDFLILLGFRRLLYNPYGTTNFDTRNQNYRARLN